MATKQQREALDYFHRAAGEWRAKAKGNLAHKVNVIAQRNGYVLKVADQRKDIRRSLDIGCGTGELACDLARRGIKAVGVDFAEDMVALSKKKAKDEKVAGTEFVLGSIFEYKPAGEFDLISANGLIEYISPAQLEQLMGLMKGWLSPGGSLVVGSRNRLFNAVTFNDYTRLEIEAGSFQALVDEIMLLTAQETKERWLEALRATPPGKLPPLDKHPYTGIGVETRYQYTPSQLAALLARYGFRMVDVYPVHYHLSSPRFAKAHPEVHKAAADMMQRFADDCFYLLPFSSSFMTHARKE